MPYCGERYHGLIRTSLGATPEEPYTYGAKLTGIPEPIDWYHWRKLAEELYAKADKAFDRVGEVETARGKGWPEWNAIVEQKNELERVYAAMGSWALTSPASGIPQAVKVSEHAACVLQMSDEALERLGESPATIITPPKGKLTDWILPIGFVVGLGFLIYRDVRSGGGGGESE